jgi:hypothetical protein
MHKSRAPINAMAYEPLTGLFAYSCSQEVLAFRLQLGQPRGRKWRLIRQVTCKVRSDPWLVRTIHVLSGSDRRLLLGTDKGFM